MKKTYLKATLFTSLLVFQFMAQSGYSACLSQLQAAAMCGTRTSYVTAMNTTCINKFGSAKCNNSYIVLEDGSQANMWTFRADANYYSCIRIKMGICEFKAQRVPTGGNGGSQ